MTSKFLVCTPFTGLGLYNGFRGNRWLRNRIKIFKQFVIPSLLAQTDRDFVHWVAWREEERTNKYVQELFHWMNNLPNYRVVFTYSGCPFWDDKYSDEEARERLFYTLKNGLPDLFDATSDADSVYWLLQPSDDCYDKYTIGAIKQAFVDDKTVQAVTYTKGYLCNYYTKEVLEYNPNTNPPFFAIKFPREIFFDPGKHINYTGPYKSHEYVGEKLKLAQFPHRGFLVGTHGENISTHFNHPFGGAQINPPFGDNNILATFGLDAVEPLKLPKSLRKWVIRRLPYRWQKKFRYLLGEVIYKKFYEWIRN